MNTKKLVTAGLLASIAGASTAAHAEEVRTIREPYDHPAYVLDAEPHFLFGYAPPFDGDHGPAVGFRGTFNLIDHGFVRSINDSVGLGVGVDFAGGDHVIVPVVLQWNFWLTQHWSVFGEPGVAWAGGGPNNPIPILAGGVRLNFNDRVGLTLRVGYPGASLGVSFFL